MNSFAALVLACVAAPAVLSCVYLLLATLLSGEPVPPKRSSRALRFDFIVPAHNEMAIIGRTVQSLREVDWPADRYRVLVVADNCTDETARVAAAAGAEVLQRDNPAQRGKGYALKFAFDESRRREWADAVVVVDADAEVTANILEAFAARLEQGAEAAQSHYGVLNPMASWRTRLITIAKGSFHIVRSRARQRLGLSCGIRGNGWCVTHKLLDRVPYKAFSLTEDIEYGIEIGLAGVRVAYTDEAHANADMVSSEEIARKQRRRWEEGRFDLVRSKTMPLLKAAVRRRDPVCLDLACDLLILPLSYVVLNTCALILLGSFTYWIHLSSLIWIWIGAGCAASLSLYVLRGWRLSGIGLQGILDLARAPVFLIWKVLLLLSRRKSVEWVRTGRE